MLVKEFGTMILYDLETFFKTIVYKLMYKELEYLLQQGNDDLSL